MGLEAEVHRAADSGNTAEQRRLGGNQSHPKRWWGMRNKMKTYLSISAYPTSSPKIDHQPLMTYSWDIVRHPLLLSHTLE